MSIPTEHESITNIREAYFCYYNKMLHRNRIDMEMFNPILSAYRNSELTLKESITLINQKISDRLNDEQLVTLSITLIDKLELIIEGETSLKLSNMCKIHNVALKNNLDTRCDFKACILHIVNSEGLEIVSFYTGFTRLVMEY